MIYLITGEPGDGKTNLAVDLIKARSEAERRPVYTSGLTILDPEALPWQAIEPAEWFNAPVGSIVLIDEAQTTFEPRQRGKPQPEFARQLETHRHSGIDLYLVTQHPTLIDSHDRKLVGTHHYVRRKMGTAWKTVYTFKGCADYPERVRSKALDSRETSDNKAAFGWYKSTELNTTRRQIPKKLWVLVFCLLAVPGLLGWVAWRVKERREAQAAQKGLPGPSGNPAVGGSVLPGKARLSGSEKLTVADWLADQSPRVAGLAYTAPVFDGVTQPKEAPYPAACVQSATRCSCYTQQATVLEVPSELCLSIVKRGFFVAWRSPSPLPSSQERVGGSGGSPPDRAVALPVALPVSASDLSLAEFASGRRSLANGRTAPALSSAARAGAGEAGP